MNPNILSAERKSSLAGVKVTTQWNLLLNGLTIIVLNPEGKANTIRIVLPYVNSPTHTHVYKTGHTDPWSSLAPGANELLFDYTPQTPPQVGPTDTDKVVILKSSLPASAPVLNFTPGAIPDGVACWIDAPMPDQIIPLRPRPRNDGTPCAWSFGGTKGYGKDVTSLPFLIALVYNDVDPTLPFPGFPGSPTPGAGNLFLFSEPEYQMANSDSTPAFAQLLKVLGLQTGDWDISGSDDPACRPNPDPVPPVNGVNSDDEQDLEERNGPMPMTAEGPPVALSNGKKNPFGVQIRACMSVILT